MAGAGFSIQELLWIAIQLVVVVFSIMVHEISHGAMAYALGDPTAREAGRLTLNPARHLDPFGSVLLPLLMALAHGPVFAYAKPVPYNPAYFKHRKRDELLVAFAGPLSNLALGLFFAGLALALSAFVDEPAQVGGLRWWAFSACAQACFINFVLLFFNIIPLPPLDGSSIIGAILPERFMGAFYQIKQYSMLILLALLFLVPMVFSIDPLGMYFDATAERLFDLVMPTLYVYY